MSTYFLHSIKIMKMDGSMDLELAQKIYDYYCNEESDFKDYWELKEGILRDGDNDYGSRKDSDFVKEIQSKFHAEKIEDKIRQEYTDDGERFSWGLLKNGEGGTDEIEESWKAFKFICHEDYYSDEIYFSNDYMLYNYCGELWDWKIDGKTTTICIDRKGFLMAYDLDKAFMLDCDGNRISILGRYSFSLDEITSIEKNPEETKVGGSDLSADASATQTVTQTSSSQNNYEWYTDVSEAEMYDLKQNLLKDKDCCYHNNASGEWNTKFVFTFPADNSPEVKTAMEKVLKFVTETKTASKGYELQFWPGDEPKIYGNRIIFNFKELEVQDEIPYDDKAFSDVKIPFSISILEALGIDSVKEFAHLFARRSSNSDFECVQYCNMYVPLHQDEGYINDEGDYVIDIGGDFDGSSCTRVFYDPDTMDLVLFYYIRIEDLTKEKIPVTQTGVYQYNFERERIYGAGPVTFVERLGNNPTNIEDICDIREMKYLLVDKEDVVKEGNKFFLSRSSLKKYVEIADKTGRLNEELRNYFK